MAYNFMRVLRMTCSDAEENARLRSRLAAGDEPARQRMIEGNMPLVVNKVEALVAKYPKLRYLYDDLISAGLLRLVEAVDGVPGLPEDDSQMVAGYLGQAVNNAIADEIGHSSTVRISRRSLKRIKSNGKTPPAAVTLDQDVSQDAPQYWGGIELVEMRDLLRACCETDADRTLMSLREAGCCYAEIAGELGVCQTTVHRRLHAIEARLRERLSDLQQ